MIEIYIQYNKNIIQYVKHIALVTLRKTEMLPVKAWEGIPVYVLPPADPATWVWVNMLGRREVRMERKEARKWGLYVGRSNHYMWDWKQHKNKLSILLIAITLTGNLSELSDLSEFFLNIPMFFPEFFSLVHSTLKAQLENIRWMWSWCSLLRISHLWECSVKQVGTFYCIGIFFFLHRIWWEFVRQILGC